MTRWFKLTSSTSYSWRSKLSGKLYSFVSPDQIVAVDDERDQMRILSMQDRLTEVDQRGSVIDHATGQTLPTAFSRHGMTQPKSYAKITRTAPTRQESSRDVASPRKVVSSKKVVKPPVQDVLPEETAVEALEAPVVAADVLPAKVADDASESLGRTPSGASQDSVPKKRTKQSSKKSGRKGD